MRSYGIGLASGNFSVPLPALNGSISRSDVIALAEAVGMDDLGKLVVARIQAVDGVARTLTCPIIKL